MGLKISLSIVICFVVIAYTEGPSLIEVKNEFCSNQFVIQGRVIGILVSNDKYSYTENPVRKNRLEYKIAVTKKLKGKINDTISVFSAVFPYRNITISLGNYIPRPIAILDSLTLFLSKDDTASHETGQEIFIANFFYFNEDYKWMNKINNCDSTGVKESKKRNKKALTIDSLLNKMNSK